jgi:predicted polyphosphate/ATP-dependent NAD kinase
MKNNLKLILTIIVTALACVLVPSPASAADTGKLTVMRSATLGKKLVLDVDLDGKRVGQLQRGKSYTTSLPVGTHEVKVQASTQRPMNKATKQVTIEAGKDSTVTASWDGQQLVLR